MKIKKEITKTTPESILTSCDNAITKLSLQISKMNKAREKVIDSCTELDKVINEIKVGA